jgi:hypothetical protein
LKMEMYYNSVAGSWFSCAVIKEKAINWGGLKTKKTVMLTVECGGWNNVLPWAEWTC